MAPEDPTGSAILVCPKCGMSQDLHLQRCPLCDWGHNGALISKREWDGTGAPAPHPRPNPVSRAPTPQGQSTVTCSRCHQVGVVNDPTDNRCHNCDLELFCLPSPLQEERLAQWCLERGSDQKFNAVYWGLLLFVPPFTLIGVLGVPISIRSWMLGRQKVRLGKELNASEDRPDYSRPVGVRTRFTAYNNRKDARFGPVGPMPLVPDSLDLLEIKDSLNGRELVVLLGSWLAFLILLAVLLNALYKANA